MATITASASGGNWNQTGTWVGGVVPVAGDDVVFNATSGSVTVTDNRTCLTLNFTGYTNTFTIANAVTLTVTGTAVTLGSGMTFASGTTGVLSVSGNKTLTFNGITIPRLTLTGVQTLTVSGTNPTVTNLVVAATNDVYGNPLSATIAGTALQVTTSYTLTTGQLAGLVLQITGDCTLSRTSGALNGITVVSGAKLTLNSDFPARGVITFQPGSSLDAKTSTMTIYTTSTIDSSTVTWWNIHNQSDNMTVTLSSDLNVANNFTFQQSLTEITYTGAKVINVGGSMTSTAFFNRAIQFTGMTINLIGSGFFAFRWIRGGTFNINSSNPTGYQIGSAVVTGANFMYIESSTINLVGNTVCSVYPNTATSFDQATIDTNRSSTGGSNVIYNSMSIANSITLNSETTCNGNVAFSTIAWNPYVYGSKLRIGGNISTTLPLFGTSAIEFFGTGNSNWTVGTYSNTGGWIINKTGGGTVTLTGNVTLGTAITYTHTSGTIIPNTNTFATTGGSTFNVSSTGFNLYNWSVGSGTSTINGGNIVINNQLSFNGNTVFAGSGAWTAAIINDMTAGRTLTLKDGNTYTVTSSLTLEGTRASRFLVTSSDATNRTNFVLNQGAAQQLIFVSGTRCDSSAGQTIWTVAGILTNTINWNLGTRPAPFNSVRAG